MNKYDSHKNTFKNIFKIANQILYDLHINFDEILNCRFAKDNCFVIQYNSTGRDSYMGEEKIYLGDLFDDEFPQCHIERKKKAIEERKRHEKEVYEQKEKERIRQEKLEYERLKSIYGNKEKEDTEKYIKEQANYFVKENEAKLDKIKRYSEKKPIYFMDI